MGPQFVLAGIPAIQVGHETYPDVLVRNGLAPSATTPEALARAFLSMEQPRNLAELSHHLGIRDDWKQTLSAAVRQP